MTVRTERFTNGGAFPVPMSCLLRRWFVVRVACGVLIASVVALEGRAAKSPWQPIPAEELAQAEPLLEKEAPAEALVHRIEIDDTEFPLERRSTQYLRYKIFAPEKVEHITRISGIDSTMTDNRVELRARLTLPDGRVQEFGKEAVKERTLSKSATEAGFLGWLTSGGAEVREKFLAISGIEAGAVLEYHVTRRGANPPRVTTFSAQIVGIPVRQFTYVCRTLRGSDVWESRTFVRNTQNAQLTNDKKGVVTVTASDLPSIVREPFVGPATDYSLTIFNCNEIVRGALVPRSGKVPVPGTIDVKLGPWAPHATVMNWIERDRGYPTAKVKAKANEITAGLSDPEAKARAIHVAVQELWQKHRRRTGPAPEKWVQPDSLDDVLEVEKPGILRYPEEFVWLSLAMCRAVGLDAKLVVLPTRRLTRFNPQHVSGAFLDHKAVALRFGEAWVFSYPQAVNRQSFGTLPWDLEGQVGLLALEKKQEFIKIPTTDPERSEIVSTGKFKLDAEGVLTGQVTRTFTGQTAVDLRGELRRNQKTARERIAATKLGVDAKLVEVTITKIDALDDAEKPLLIAATLRWPGFATRTKDRLLVRPGVFRVENGSPFTASERRHPVHFPYRWRETDRIEIAIPEGFVPEAPTAPPAFKGEALQHELKLAYDPKNGVLHATREFTSHLLNIPVDLYPVLKGGFDRIARADGHEVVFTRKAAGQTGE